MTVMFVLSGFIGLLGVVAAVWKGSRLPDSISGMVWLLPEGGWRWLWSVWLWTVLFLAVPSMIEAMPDSFRFVAFLGVACLMLVGAMPLFDCDHSWHNALGVAGCVLSQVCVAVLSPWWLMAWLLFIAPLFGAMAAHGDREDAVFCEGRGVFFAEAICAATVFGAVMIN